MPLIAKPLLPLSVPQVEARTKATVAAKYYITLPCIDAVGGGTVCPDNQVIKAIAVDVPGAADRRSLISSFDRDAVNRKAVAAVERGQVEAGTKATVAAKHHITLPCIQDAVGVGTSCPDNQVIKAIAVDVPGAADRPA
jgi:hypothetical protein